MFVCFHQLSYSQELWFQVSCDLLSIQPSYIFHDVSLQCPRSRHASDLDLSSFYFYYGDVWKCQCCPPEIVKMSKKTRGRKWINDKQQDEREKQSNSQSKEFANLLQSHVGTSSLLWITETYLIETVKHICCPFPPASIHCLMGIFLQEFQQSFLSGVPKEDEEQSVNKDLCEQSLFITGWFMVSDYNM